MSVQRGVPQGGPLSPPLFSLCTNHKSATLQYPRTWQSTRRPSEPSVSDVVERMKLKYVPCYSLKS